MKKLDIFIVDDNRDFVEMLAMVMEGRGHHVTTAYNGEEAIEIFSQSDFDITFMDVKMPGKNGVESFLEIKKMKPEARIVMMTGYSVEQLLDQAIENGAWRILHKPLDIKKVIEILDEISEGGVLIVDDDRDFVDSVEDILSNRGMNVYKAYTGKEAIEQVTTNNIDILILDLRLPFLDGLGTYLEIQKQGYALPTIVVTAYAKEEVGSLEQLQSMNNLEILRKPFDPNNLLDILDKLIINPNK